MSTQLDQRPDIDRVQRTGTPPLDARDARRNAMVTAGLNALLGVWLIAAPFILAYHATLPTFNDVVLGFGVGGFAIIRMAAPARFRAIAWTNLVLGAWIVAAPFVLGYLGNAPAFTNDILTGLAVFGFGAWGALMGRRSAPR